MSTTTRWVIDPAHSSAEFRVPHFWGLVKVKGRFDRLDGWLEVDDNGSHRLELIIDATSVNTGHRSATSTSAQPTSSTPNDTPTFTSSQAKSATPITATSMYTGSCSRPATGWCLNFGPRCGRSTIRSRST